VHFNFLSVFIFKQLIFCSRDNVTLFSCRLWEVGELSDEVTCILNLDSVIDRFCCEQVGQGKNEYGWGGFRLTNLHTVLRFGQRKERPEMQREK
jgi:hypothetical protein